MLLFCFLVLLSTNLQVMHFNILCEEHVFYYKKKPLLPLKMQHPDEENELSGHDCLFLLQQVRALAAVLGLAYTQF